MQVVVTGASGNVGTALLRALRQQRPDWTVTGLCRRPPAASTPPYDSARWVALDLTAPTAARQLVAVMHGADAVVHLAWAIAPSHDPGFMTRVNVEGSRRVARAARAAGVSHLVHASSVGAYRGVPERGPAKRPVGEDWPSTGIPSSLYSRHKVAVERLLDDIEASGSRIGGGPVPAVARIRPGLILQSAAGSEVARYFVGSALPTFLLGRLPVVPVPPGIAASAVHSEDVADAVVRILDTKAVGAFNLAADDVLTAQGLAAALGGRLVSVPAGLARAAVDLSWRIRLQPTDAGWLDMALSSPLLDSGRAARELGWQPAHSAQEALLDVITGMASGSGTGSPAMAPRSFVRDLLPNRLRMR